MRTKKSLKNTYVILNSDCREYSYADSIQDIKDHLDNMSSNFTDFESFFEFVNENIRVFKLGKCLKITIPRSKISVG